MRFRLATRGSALAMIQAQLVANLLSRRYPEHVFELTPLTTHGDRHPSLSLTDAPREGVFVKELEQALLAGQAELAVHSAKDLPTLETRGLVVAAFLPRGDARDVLIGRQRATLSSLAPGARVATGSPRRAAQIRAARPDVTTVAIRGNVDTRLRKLREGVADVLVLAAAGLERLGRLDEAHEFLPFDVMLPAPGQGALALQGVEGSEAAALAAAVDDPGTSRAVRAERALLRRLGGGCLSALGAYAHVDGADLVLQAVVLSADGTQIIRAGARGATDATVVEEVAVTLEAQGAARMLTPRVTNSPHPDPSPQGEREDKALRGLRVMVTRADEQAAELAQALEAHGAVAVLCPVIAIEPLPVDGGWLARIEQTDWLVLTSANGADRLVELLREAGRALPAHIKVATIGPKTAARCRVAGIEPSLIPDRYVAEELADALNGVIRPGTRVLLARAQGSRDVLPERLRAAGASVEVLETYRAGAPPDLRSRLRSALPNADMITFTSSSTVRNFVAAFRQALPERITVACIGPVTAQTARELGLRVDIIAEEYTTRGLVEAIIRGRTPVSP